MTPEHPGGPRIFARDIAQRHKISLRQACRRLKQLEDRYGKDVVGRAGQGRRVRRYTTDAALERIGPQEHSRLFDLYDAIARLERRVDQLERGRFPKASAGQPRV